MIRHPIVCPTKPLDSVRLPEEEEGRHFGLSFKDELVSVISLVVENSNAPFRKFATLQESPGKGFGTILLHEIMWMAQPCNS